MQHLFQEAYTFLVAGFESVSATLAWACIYMSLYPHIQETLHEEVMKVLGKKKPTLTDIKQLPYVRSVLQEVQRLHAPIVFLLKRVVKNDSIGRLEMKKDDLIFIPIYHLHRMSRYWPNPEGFDPTRFLKPLGEEYNNIYIPFGGGPRSCIGRNFSMLEGTIILAMIVQRYKLYLKSGTIVKQDLALVNRPNIDIMMTVHPYV
jgi:cytochrome P450